MLRCCCGHSKTFSDTWETDNERNPYYNLLCNDCNDFKSIQNEARLADTCINIY